MFPGAGDSSDISPCDKNGLEVYMGWYKYGVLSFLARHPGKLLAKEQIFEAVGTKTVTAICELYLGQAHKIATIATAFPSQTAW